MSRVDIAGSVFGHIPGIPVGTRWVDRLAMSQDHVHPPLVAGIYGRKDDGARSVVLGGIYDDEDHGETFTYIGSGGRAPGVRFGEQTVDQTFENNLNQALRTSAKRQVPVRVIRGPNLKSRYTPYAGYRYDGVYTVHNPRQEVGAKGFLVCKFDFRRIPNQPPLPELETRPPDDVEIRRAQFRAARKRRTTGGGGGGGAERPITAKWEGAGAAPAPAPARAPRRTLAAAAAGPVGRTASASTIRPTPRPKAQTQTQTQRHVFSSTTGTGSGSASSSRAGTPSSGAFGPPASASASVRSGSVLSVDPREYGFDDDDEDLDLDADRGEDEEEDEDEDEEDDEDDEDQDDIFRAVDMVTATFRPIQEKLDEINKPRITLLSGGSDTEAQEDQLRQQRKQETRKRRKLLVEIGDHIRQVLSHKFGSDAAVQVLGKGKGKARASAAERREMGGYTRTWWEKELWEYAARYLPLGKDGRMMLPGQLQIVYRKYKKQRQRQRQRSERVRSVDGSGHDSGQAGDEEEVGHEVDAKRKRKIYGALESKGRRRVC